MVSVWKISLSECVMVSICETVTVESERESPCVDETLALMLLCAHFGPCKAVAMDIH